MNFHAPLATAQNCCPVSTSINGSASEVFSLPAGTKRPDFVIVSSFRCPTLHPGETLTKSGLLVPAGSEKTSEALPLIDVDTGQQFWAVASGAWKFIWPPTGKVVLAVRESQIIAEEELSKTSENGQLPIMK
jgi:hypothetical protein